MLDVAGGSQTPVQYPALGNRTRFNALFADGSAVLFSAQPSPRGLAPNSFQLYRLPVIGGVPVALTPVLDYQPVEADLSPDGAQVAFAAGRRVNEPPQVFLGAGGGAPRVLATGPPNHFPGTLGWAPDGRRLAVSWNYRNSGRVTLSRAEVVGLDGSRKQLRAAPASFNERLSWSPEGRYIAMDSLRGTVLASTRSRRATRRGFRGTDSPQWVTGRPGRPVRVRYRTCITVNGGREVKRVGRGRRARYRLRTVNKPRRTCSKLTKRPSSAGAERASSTPPRPRARTSQVVAPGPGLCTGASTDRLERRIEWCGRTGWAATEYRYSSDAPPRVIGRGSGWAGARVDFDRLVEDREGTYWTRIGYYGGTGTMAGGVEIKYSINCATLTGNKSCLTNGDDVTKTAVVSRVYPTESSVALDVTRRDFDGDTRFNGTAGVYFSVPRASSSLNLLTTPTLRCNRRGGIGCVFPDFQPTFALSRSDPDVGASADFIARSQLLLLGRQERNGVGNRPLVREANQRHNMWMLVAVAAAALILLGINWTYAIRSPSALAVPKRWLT